MNKHIGISAAALLAAVTMPLGFAAPAQASTTKDGCTVTPHVPYFAGTYTAANVPEVFYEYVLTCAASTAAMSVEVKTQAWEQDLAGQAGDVDFNGVNNADDEHIGNATTSRSFTKAGGTKTVKVKGVLSRTDTNGSDEPYQRVKFRVTSGAVTGSWSSWELTAASEIFW